MVISLAVAFLGSVVAAVGTGVITARCFRSPRADLICLAAALLGLTVALGALTLGNLLGFGSATFRVMELGGQVLAPLALCLGLAEMAGTTIVVRFAARLILSALAVVAFVILSTDQLNPAAAFSKAWPAAAVHYETIPVNLLKLGLAPVTAIIALVAIGVAVTRSGRDPAWRPAAVAISSAGGGALVLAVPAAVTLPGGSMFAIACLAAAALAWFAGMRAGDLPGDLRAGRPADDDDDRWHGHDSWAGHVDQTGDFDALVTGGEGLYRGNGLYRPDAGQNHDARPAYPQHDDDDYDDGYDYQRDGRDAGYPASGYRGDEADPSYASNGHGRPAPDARYEEYGDEADHAEPDLAGDGADSALRSGIWQAGGAADRPGTSVRGHSAADPGIPVADQDAQARLFGQIAIYTLLEDRVDEFDLLTERVVGQVRTREPDTLVYIVHAVPSAPMQRILYEVYRDRAAYDDHRRQPYVARFEIDRRPYVLATNVIELGLQQAKVSPLPSIADLLDPSGPASQDFIQPVTGRHPGPGQSGYSHPGPGHPAPGHPGPAQHGTGDASHGDASYSEPEYGKPRYTEPGYPEPDYHKPRYTERGYAEPGHDSASHDSASHDSASHDSAGYDSAGYDSAGYDSAGYDKSGYDSAGYDEAGYDSAGYDEAGYDSAGLREPGYGGQPGHDKLPPDGHAGPADREEGTQRQW